jgi:hypothetical protein
VQRDEACFIEFGVSDREYALAEIHVVLIQAEGFFDPEPRDCEQTEQRRVGPRTQARRGVKISCRRHQLSDLGEAVDVRQFAASPMREKPQGRDLGAGVRRAVVLSEEPHGTETRGPVGGLGTRWLHRPTEGQVRRDVRHSLPFKERDEVVQVEPRVLQLVPEPSPQAEVVVHGLQQSAHAFPPEGQGRARALKATRSTFA